MEIKLSITRHATMHPCNHAINTTICVQRRIVIITIIIANCLWSKATSRFFCINCFLFVLILSGLPTTNCFSQALNWAQKASSEATDYSKALAVDAAGNVYITGYFEGRATFGEKMLTSIASSDIFLVKYDASGKFQWAQQAGGNGYDFGNGISTDPAGNIYITGYFEGKAFFAKKAKTPFTKKDPGGSKTITSIASSDLFIAKYNQSGSLLWVQQARGSIKDYGNSISVDASGNIYATRQTPGTATFGAGSVSNPRGTDIFITKFSSSGQLQWLQQAGGIGYTHGNGIIVDHSGNVFVTGYFEGTATVGDTSLTSDGSIDFFITKYSSKGLFQWVQQAWGGGNEK